MNKLRVTLNPVKVKSFTLDVSDNFEKQVIDSIKECTSIDIEFFTCDKSYFVLEGYNMIRYHFDNLPPEKLQELEAYSKQLFISFNNAINHAQQ